MKKLLGWCLVLSIIGAVVYLWCGCKDKPFSGTGCCGS
jgi:hypothetical protein